LKKIVQQEASHKERSRSYI